MTPVFCCGFECGVTAGHWDLFSNASFSTNIVRNGSRSLRLLATTSSTALIAFSVTSATIMVCRFYFYATTLPNVSVQLASDDNTNANYNGCWFNSADSKIYAGYPSNFGATGVSVTTGQWYLVDMRINRTTTSNVIDVSVNGVACGQKTNPTGSSGNSTLMLGTNVSSTMDIYFDDVLMSATSADYPLGAGYVNHFVPTSDGTHTATTTTIVKGTIAAPTGGGNVAGATDVFNWVNSVPLLGGATDNTRLVNQQTAGATLYAEVKFGAASGISTPITAPRAVEVITADREASTATCDFTAKLNDNGTEGTIIARGVVAGSTTDRYATKQFAIPPTGGSWNAGSSGAGAFNNIKARWGYASDATPDLYWRGIMIEAEFAQVAAAFKPALPKIISQAIQRSNSY